MMKIIFERIPRTIVGILMFLALSIQGANVVARYLFRAPFIWAEEILVFIMIWIIFTGTILVSMNGAHLRMDFVASSFPNWISRHISRFIELIVSVVCGIMGYASLNVLITIGKYSQKSVVAEIPMVIPHVAIPLSFMVISILHFINFIQKSSKKF